MVRYQKIILLLFILLNLVRCASSKDYGTPYYVSNDTLGDGRTKSDDSLSIETLLSKEEMDLQKYLTMGEVDLAKYINSASDIDNYHHSIVSDSGLLQMYLTYVDTNFTSIEWIAQDSLFTEIKPLANVSNINIQDSGLMVVDSIIMLNIIETPVITDSLVSAPLSLDSIMQDATIPNTDFDSIGIVDVSIIELDSFEYEVELLTDTNNVFTTELYADSLTKNVDTTIVEKINPTVEIALSENQIQVELQESMEAIIIAPTAVTSTPTEETIVISETTTPPLVDTIVLTQDNPENLKLIDSLNRINEQLRALSGGKDIDTLVYTLFFNTGQQTLNSNNEKTLQDIIHAAETKDSYSIQISGHTDKNGSALLNKNLSVKRVQNVHDFLLEQNIDDRKIFQQSFGEKYATTDQSINERIVYCRLIITN